MPVFYKERIMAYAEVVEEETKKLADSLEEGTPIPMHEAMMQLTLGIVARSLFKTELDSRKAELAAAVDVTIRETAGTIFSPLILPFGIPTPGHVKHKRAIRTLEAMIYEAIAKARANPEHYSDSMLGLLLDTQDESGQALNDREIRDQMMTMLLAGHETTANALVWAWYCLERTPDAAARLRAEQDELREEEQRTGKSQPAYRNTAEWFTRNKPCRRRCGSTLPHGRFFANRNGSSRCLEIVFRRIAAF